jgi:hypothetical protein
MAQFIWHHLDRPLIDRFRTASFSYCFIIEGFHDTGQLLFTGDFRTDASLLWDDPGAAALVWPTGQCCRSYWSSCFFMVAMVFLNGAADPGR